MTLWAVGITSGEQHSTGGKVVYTVYFAGAVCCSLEKNVKKGLRMVSKLVISQQEFFCL